MRTKHILTDGTDNTTITLCGREVVIGEGWYHDDDYSHTRTCPACQRVQYPNGWASKYANSYRNTTLGAA